VQLQKILTSPEFRVSDRLKEFFRFVVEETLAGRTHEIKAYTIAMKVFGRDSHFDAAKDPIVRIQAGKLRRAIERYYFVSGTEDPIRIEIPLGAYIAKFERQSAKSLPEQAQCPMPDDAHKTLSQGATLGLIPFDNLTRDGNLYNFAAGLTDDLRAEITKFKQLKVIACQISALAEPMKATSRSACVDLGVNYLLGGSIRQEQGMLKIVIWLADTATGEHIWGSQYKRDYMPASSISLQEEIAKNAAARIAGEYGLVARLLIKKLSQKISPAIGAEEAILYYYRFDRERTRESWQNAFDALTIATKTEPHYGLAWSLLAQLHIASIVLDGHYGNLSMEQALSYALRGVAKSPSNPIVREILAWSYFHLDDINTCMVELKKALKLDSGSAYQTGVIGWDMCLCGDWDRGLPLLKNAMDMNPHYPDWWRFALILYQMRRKAYHQALMEAMPINVPDVFWVPLIRAALLGLLNKIDEARIEAEKLLLLKPEIKKEKNRILGILIKDQEMKRRIVEGLELAGI
jgi:adenylate cyclase